MQRKNFTEVTDLIFLGFSIFGKHQLMLFVVFLTVYILTLTSNVIIVTIIRVDRHLHTPMYFLLSMLASSETVYTLVIVPRMLSSLLFHNQPISLAGCATQMFFFVTLATSNCFLLTAMGYDRYLAICSPLRYTVLMSKGVCATLVCGSFGTGLAMAVLHVAAMFNLPFLPMPNSTAVTEFLLEGFSSFGWQHRLVFFAVFLTLYLLTLCGNVIIVTIIHLDRHLHTPMYFFLSMLSLSETCYTVAIIPRMLSGLLNPHQPIAVQGCATQLFFYLTFGINNCFLLTAMGYDRYVAICNPLRYSVIMSKETCVQLAYGSLGIGLSMAIIQVTSVFGLPFCDAFVISHFFCDVRPLLKLACMDTTVNEIINFVVSVCVLVLPMGLVFISYVLIISTILKITSAEGRKKAFATCASHLTVVIIHYGCASIIYLKPKSQSSLEQDRLLSVTYTVITPLLNPVVYSLRNKEVKDALHRAVGRNLSS
ncbi:olfactory receptor 10J3 isoform X1 [Canis lupus familiaris]|uniref:olfactory receptor 10J3 isoform X1 n=1 Tax=Canis lupus familiaris TaxID=9615 RepID=UPI0018F41580|nr:olfactory receptor 10J3 isoform X1 [Canis lupus familiaris]